MKRFFEATFRPFLVVAGVGTAAAGLFALWPAWMVTHLVALSFRPEYSIIVQHWGVMTSRRGAPIEECSLGRPMDAGLRPSWEVGYGERLKMENQQ